mmetsp:Transcript_72731/g.121861  ORF Transcript_72731/g.121861 Transcript_72731/m.121861 type:complete len:97 (+) Transcript_72731:1167-1457(+)
MRLLNPLYSAKACILHPLYSAQVCILQRTCQMPSSVIYNTAVMLITAKCLRNVHGQPLSPALDYHRFVDQVLHLPHFCTFCTFCADFLCVSAAVAD